MIQIIIFSLSILVSGKMSVWCDGVQLHTIKPGQMLNSIEWKAIQFDLDYKISKVILIWPTHVINFLSCGYLLYKMIY